MADRNRKQRECIAVILPVYNVEKYLGRCLESLLCQTYRNLEIILVDDGSSDASGRLCEEFAEKYRQVRTYHKQNGGLSDARNYGVQKAESGWIVFVDPDDYVEPDYIEILWKLKEKYHADMSAVRIRRQYEGERSCEKRNRYQTVCIHTEDALFEIYSGNRGDFQACGKLIKRSSLLKHPFPVMINEDLCGCCQLVNDCDTVVLGDYRWLYHYIHRSGSLVAAGRTEEIYGLMDYCKTMGKDVRKRFSDTEKSRVLAALFCQRAIITTLNMHDMPWKQFKFLYMKYRLIFRNNLALMLKNRELSFDNKAYAAVLAFRPELFYLIKKLKKHR